MSETYSKTFIIDLISHALVNIDSTLYEVHKGNSFTVADTVVCNTTTVKWQITTPDSTKYSHLVFQLASTGEATFLVTEGSDRTDGTALPEVNRNRVPPITTAATIVSRTPTGGTTDGAVVLFSMRNGITDVASKNIEGSNARATNKWILAPDTKYVVSITTYADVYATLIVDWYEKTRISS